MASVFPQWLNGIALKPALERHVLIAAFALQDWRAWETQVLAIIDPRERGRAERQRQPRHRTDLVLAYALHRLVLAHALGVPAAQVPLARDARGRPMLEGRLEQTSLSHAEGVVAVAVSMSGDVGVDIEPVSRAQVMPEIAGRICHAAESARIAQVPDADRAAALLDLWVRKEAFLKAAGVGLEREMDTFSLPVEGVLALHPDGTATVEIERLDLGPDVVCAVARPPGAGCIAGWLRPMRRDEVR